MSLLLRPTCLMPFQSTHSRGVRRLQTYFCFKLIVNFNPRTHEECDFHFSEKNKTEGYFNPRTHEECDRKSRGTRYSDRKFQSTHSRGVRLRQRSTSAIGMYFNPRTHEECDMSCVALHSIRKRFQSTHSRGVRPKLFKKSVPACVFQSTHSRGVRRADSPRIALHEMISIHALTRSATWR